MAVLSRQWVRSINSRGTRRVMLLTLGFSPFGRQPPGAHPSQVSGAYAFSTHPECVVTDATGNNPIPFWPTMLNWPVVTYAWAPEERRAETPVVQVALSRDSGLNDVLDTIDGEVSGMARLDLWTDGADMNELIPLVQGVFRVVGRDRRNAVLTIEIEDGAAIGSVLIPPGKIDAIEFPDAPAQTVGVAERQTVFGAFPDNVPIHQIDQEGLVFYVCEPPAHQPPSIVTVSGVDVDVRWRAETRTMASSRTPYTAIVFERNPASVGYVGPIACRLGVGIVSESPALTILRDLAGYPVSARAEVVLRTLGFNQSAYVGSQVDALTLVRDRLMPQTDVVLAMRAGLVDAIHSGRPAGQMDLAPGQGLRFRLPEPEPVTSLDNVFNAFDISYGRDVSQGIGATATGATVVLDSTTGGAIGRYLAASQQRYGVRRLAFTAPDLADESDALLLAEHMALTHAFQHRRHRYAAEWFEGLTLDENTRVLLTDSDEAMSEEPCRVVRIEYTANGPVVVMQSEDTGHVVA